MTPCHTLKPGLGTFLCEHVLEEMTAAAILFYGGAWIFKTYHHFDQLTTANITLIPASIIIGVGIILFIIGLLGIVAAGKENRWLLAAYFIALLVVLTAEVTAGLLAYLYRSHVTSAVSDGLKIAINKYDNVSSIDHDQIDYVQRELECCGVKNATDWRNTKWYKTYHAVPESCCMPQTMHNVTCDTKLDHHSTGIYHQGCYERLKLKFLDNLTYITSAGITFALLQIIGLIATCILCCRTRGVIAYKNLNSNVSANGLRV
ncbi:tetraspanin-36 isoform X1 [Octopus bimaculoides]|uniref:tetraspanin-36 isoform X1 n=1 Tax=Octopus bimaculoides TaxID=37653 RepID=UPI00071CAD4B|nr:tetraspanin-36 isoform X1 [Octopus bimaculoides]|eukprot:XP_014783242.1 PREDICTED: tetraspanin-3-like isoform X1 [Octopus bimaculoides]